MRQLLVLTVLMCGRLHAAAIPVTNPGFELGAAGTPLTASIYSYDTGSQPYGWNISAGNLEFVRSGYVSLWTTQEGDYAVDMNGVGAGNTVLSQSIEGFTPGVSYTLTFAMSANIAGCFTESPCALRAGISGATGDYRFGSAVMTWSDQTLNFVASATTLNLSFTDLTGRSGAAGPAIDNVRIDEAPGVPEPGSLFLAGAGLAVVWRQRRRFRGAH